MSSLDVKALKEKALAFLEKPHAFLAVVGVILLLDAALILRWQFASLGNIFKEAGKLKSDIVATYDESKASEAQKEQFKVHLAEQERLNNMILGARELPKVLESISEFAKISSVRILRIQPVDVGKRPQDTGDDKPLKQKISVTAKAGFHQLGRFIGLLEGGSVFVDFKNLEIKGDMKQPGKQQHVTILLEVFKNRD